jgi:hypothetical protein
MNQIKRRTKHIFYFQVLLFAIPIVMAFVGCGTRPRVAETDSYFINTEPVVERLQIIERELRVYAEGLSERKDMGIQKAKLVELQKELVDIIANNEKINPVFERTAWLQVQLLNWQQALLLGINEALLSTEQDQVKLSFNIYRYLDLASDYGRIARSERTVYDADMHGPN